MVEKESVDYSTEPLVPPSKDSSSPAVQRDMWMEHFMASTWQIQGPDFVSNIVQNMPRFTKETMWISLPKVSTDTCILVGAGPSLDKNIHLLAEVPEEWPVILTDRAAPKALKYCKNPYVITNLESTIEMIPTLTEWWKDIDTEKYRLLTVTTADPGVPEIWKGPVYFINSVQNAHQLMRLANKITFKTGCPPIIHGSNVGVMSAIFAMNLLKGAYLNGKAKETTLKRLVFIGVDHCEYTEAKEVNVNINDINGTDCWLNWNWFIGQFELRFLAKDALTKGARVFNCTEGGIVYSDDIVKMGFKEFLEDGHKLTERKEGEN